MIKKGDNLWILAQQNGGCVEKYVSINPGINPCGLKVGQIINIPDEEKNCSVCSNIKGANRCDDVILEIEGVKFTVTRVGEPSIPHEVQLIIPRTEISKTENPYTGCIETSIMISNVNIINSPRIRSEGTGVEKSKEVQQ